MLSNFSLCGFDSVPLIALQSLLRSLWFFYPIWVTGDIAWRGFRSVYLRSVKESSADIRLITGCVGIILPWIIPASISIPLPLISRCYIFSNHVNLVHLIAVTAWGVGVYAAGQLFGFGMQRSDKQSAKESQIEMPNP
jgi:hypothetical protein